MALNPEIIGDIFFRNNKVVVIDPDGRCIFNGKTTRVLKVAPKLHDGILSEVADLAVPAA